MFFDDGLSGGDIILVAHKVCLAVLDFECPSGIEDKILGED